MNTVTMTPKRNLFFDLDGTLTDAGEGITRCLQHALRTLDEPVPDPAALQRYIGPPLWDSFTKLLARPSAERIDAAISAYRERYVRIGMYENSLYPGILDCLKDFSRRAFQLYVITSKPHVFASKITDHFRIASFFRKVHGPELNDEKSTKADLIAQVLAEYAIDPDAAVMIGDRKHDAAGALANGVYSIGVCWGYGSSEELTSAGAQLLVDSPRELMNALAA
jgi:phosphoglycolate phosphatase